MEWQFFMQIPLSNVKNPHIPTLCIIKSTDNSENYTNLMNLFLSSCLQRKRELPCTYTAMLGKALLFDICGILSWDGFTKEGMLTAAWARSFTHGTPAKMNSKCISEPYNPCKALSTGRKHLRWSVKNNWPLKVSFIGWQSKGFPRFG